MLFEEPPARTAAELLRDFANTYDVEQAEESLRAPSDLVEWLAYQGLAPEAAQAGTAALDAALRLRAGLRAALAGHHDGAADHAGLALAAAEHPLRLGFDADRPVLLPAADPGAEPVEAGLARVVAAVAAAQSDGTWTRVKLCATADCRWAFVDTSKNRSRTWCSMRVCGNRAKTRAYRARGRDDGPPPA
ncbi:CGNR zinc finger domain-containing protein [Allonocardiopsis opalescens]|uniref:Putative RNA-binding Zn ribbon-like protein n=1 Tax=Allonocardiopsis opalescens TaxID=1144618 RepID=A0A2T0QFD2_9ACTN|nr:CGNR zinc finger domain-containing protein [Allonocardiopsis opalescens]PRY02622.1 putative RNA-binding Zn ribbon-like protein [Allonocardiopsis opalescens]